MSTSEVTSPKGPAAVESVLLDLLDPENKPLLPQTLPLSPSMEVGSGGYNSMVQAVKDIKMALEEQLVFVELSKKRVMFNHLAPLLWYSFGTIAALLQTVAAHPETGTSFLEAGIPSYLFLFLNTTSKAKSFEYYLRITSLGVLVKSSYRTVNSPSRGSRNGTFDNCLRDDPAARHFPPVARTLDNLADPHPAPVPAGGGSH